MARPTAVLALAFVALVGVVSATSAPSEFPSASVFFLKGIQKIQQSDSASRMDLYNAPQKAMAPSQSESSLSWQSLKAKSGQAPTADVSLAPSHSKPFLPWQSMKSKSDQAPPAGVGYLDSLVGIKLAPTNTVDSDVGSPVAEPKSQHDDTKVMPPSQNGATALEVSAIAGVLAATISFLL